MTILPVLYLPFKGDLNGFYISLIFIRFLHGIGLAICFTSVFTYIADIIPKVRLNEGIGMFGVTGLIGMAVGPVIAEIAINKFGFVFFFTVACLLAAIGLLLQLPLPESYVPMSNDYRHSFFSVLKKRRVFMVALLAFAFGFVLAASGNFVAPFAKEQGLVFISSYYISYSLAAVITRLVGGKLADRVGEEHVIPYATMITCAGILILIFLGGNMVLILSGLLSGCGHGFLFPCLNSVVIRNEPIGIRGKITGIFTGAIDAGAFVGSILLGYIGEWKGFKALFFASGLVLLIGLCIYRSNDRSD
jgi:MFS family permease